MTSTLSDLIHALAAIAKPSESTHSCDTVTHAVGDSHCGAGRPPRYPHVHAFWTRSWSSNVSDCSAAGLHGQQLPRSPSRAPPW